MVFLGVRLRHSWLTACVTRWWAGVDSVWEQEKLEARKMLENATESPASSARCVRRFFIVQDSLAEKDTVTDVPLIFQNSNRQTNHDSSISRPSSWAFAWFWNIAIAVAMRLKPSFL